MNSFKFICVAILLYVAPINIAYAKGSSGSWLLGMDLNYSTTKVESVVSGTTTESESGTTFYDLILGTMIDANLYVGGIYSTVNNTSKGASISTSTTGSALGASVGYVFDNGLHILGSYFLSATYQDYKRGTGYEVDLGWRSFVSGSFFIGAKLAYRSLKYTENTTITGFESYTNTSTLPYISFGFGF